jgi:hypothetical protein
VRVCGRTTFSQRPAPQQSILSQDEVLDVAAECELHPNAKAALSDLGMNFAEEGVLKQSDRKGIQSSDRFRMATGKNLVVCVRRLLQTKRCDRFREQSQTAFEEWEAQVCSK